MARTKKQNNEIAVAIVECALPAIIESVVASQPAWEIACENAVCNFTASEDLTGRYMLGALEVFGRVPADMDFIEFETKRVFWGKVYRENKEDAKKISQDAVDAAFKRFMQAAYAHLDGGYKKPKAATKDAARMAEKRAPDPKIAELANSTPLEELESKAVNLGKIVAMGKGKEQQEARAERTNVEKAIALINKTETASKKEARATNKAAITEFLKTASDDELEAVAYYINELAYAAELH